MRKIISLFQRNYDGDKLVRDEIVPGAEWVVAGEGRATRKWDGTSCMVRAGVLYKRYDAKHGKTPPAGWEPAQEPDAVTGHHPGWLAVGQGPEDRWFREAFSLGQFAVWERGAQVCDVVPNGTYELCGPRIQGNPDGFADHILVQHGGHHLDDAPRTFEALKRYLADNDMEGIVWHHPDGRMVKIKTRDFGLKRKVSP